MMATAVAPEHTMNRQPSVDEDRETEYSLEMQHSSDSNPVSLEGMLSVRKGRSSGHSTLLWRRRFVFFSFLEGGSVTVYKDYPDYFHQQERHPGKAPYLRTVYSKLHRRMSAHFHDSQHSNRENVDIEITSDLPWMAKDVQNDSNTFVIEIATGEEADQQSLTMMSLRSGSMGFESDDEEDFGEALSPQPTTTVEGMQVKDDLLHDELETAKRKGKPLRIYFRCGSSEKVLWLKAFDRLGRLSTEARTKKSLISSITSPLQKGSMTTRARTRSKADAVVAMDTRHLDLSENAPDTDSVELTSEMEELVRGRVETPVRQREREYRVQPVTAYPHRWMTRTEMKEEMVLPSEKFHDLRIPGAKEKEIGTLKVEVLQCVGLPKLDRASETDAVVYLVCGAYAFSTDVIYDQSNPMWLRKARRACIFPIYQGYARLFAGVFDHEPKKVKDDFAGRVVVELSRLRPRSTYDITLPLRLSTHVYSRRKRGAIRLRVTLHWNTERDALLSYIPKKIRIPLPQNSTPNYDVTVMCSDQKAFRNVALTVHGAHLPGRFTFNQMRAAIREINFTRKYVFTAIRQEIRETRQWQNPALSAFVFMSWMHCVFANATWLVPGYLMLYIFLILMRNYAKYGIDGPVQRGFVPPSWEEMFMALVRGGDPEYHAIEPMDLYLRPAPLSRSKSPDSGSWGGDATAVTQYKTVTHVPKGKALFRALGFLPRKNQDVPSASDVHLEFPFSDCGDYPKFGVKECLVQRKGRRASISIDSTYGNESFDDAMPWDDGEESSSHRHMFSRFPLDMDLHDLMRKDSSGTKEYDIEENEFSTSRAMMKQSKMAVKTAAKTAMALGQTTLETTRLDYVAKPIGAGITTGVRTLESGITTGASHMGSMAHHVMAGPAQNAAQRGRTSSFDSGVSMETFEETDDQDLGSSAVDLFASHGSSLPSAENSVAGDEEIDPALVFPEQNIDVEGPKTGSKLTDDLQEIKDKMHELTWHLFDDHTYVLKNSKAVFFGDGRKPEKRRKADIQKNMDKYLHIGQYSHSNPFVSRFGLYVEPIIGSSYSFLCLFRAGFNVVTWRDPFLTFLLSVAVGLLVIILFVFPWRIFLFLVGILLVGPQNWVIRILRERGHLPPAPKYQSKKKQIAEEWEGKFDKVPTDKPIFTRADRAPGNADLKPIDEQDIDPREVHHVVVPYSPLQYQRCYDWPPEPQYAQVRREPEFEETRRALARAYQQRRNISSMDQQDSAGINRLGLLRRRGRRRNSSSTNGANGMNGSGRPPVGPKRLRTPVRRRPRHPSEEGATTGNRTGTQPGSHWKDEGSMAFQTFDQIR